MKAQSQGLEIFQVISNENLAQNMAHFSLNAPKTITDFRYFNLTKRKSCLEDAAL
ncbi:hypothetical protein HMPREF0645_0656 [Hallella bergensis DSM 17361]|uniref:Uncharacterized protein n=1 Tax=Hallella bergensis DSM 17361 TaxID=585502 RepID=D1PUM1_9BACT|nr:hypothetical protein HMPREF0645_0656 [Hallella bergensis DSM 17361]